MKKEYISPVTKMVLVRLNGSILDQPIISNSFTNENLGKQGVFEEDDTNEGWAAQTNVWSSYE